jgi:two-component system response regulator
VRNVTTDSHDPLGLPTAGRYGADHLTIREAGPEAKDILDKAKREQERRRSLQRAIGMLDRAISRLRADGIDGDGDAHGPCGSALKMYEDTRWVVAMELQELEARHAAQELPMAQNDADNRTILLAQSNPDEEVLTLLAFQKARIKNRVVVVRDGIEALDYLFGTGDYEGRDTRFMPELVLLDLMMPRLSGAEVLRHIQSSERTKSLPVLVLVSSIEEQDVLEGKALKADGYIQKPIEPVRLLESVRRLKKVRWVVSN